MNNSDMQLYHHFRNEIDSYAFPLIKDEAETNGTFRHITYKGTVVGFLSVIDGNVEGIYVMPEYRRMGLARKAVLDFLKEGGEINRFHVVRTNKPAMKFWHSIFLLMVEKINFCDYLYYVLDVIKTKEKDDV